MVAATRGMGMNNPPSAPLPIEPLRETMLAWKVLRDRSLPDLAEGSRVSYRIVCRISARKQEFGTVRTADELCCAMGIHPVRVWPGRMAARSRLGREATKAGSRPKQPETIEVPLDASPKPRGAIARLLRVAVRP